MQCENCENLFQSQPSQSYHIQLNDRSQNVPCHTCHYRHIINSQVYDKINLEMIHRIFCNWCELFFIQNSCLKFHKGKKRIDVHCSPKSLQLIRNFNNHETNSEFTTKFENGGTNVQAGLKEDVPASVCVCRGGRACL